ncbi:hypothetical protein [Tropicibacter sp. Alg240-R139]|uniref:hypothetical protein n=1 Tax=Tropicibacter sp. Alg240-R139 TaxID=2305991 RepID=UPI0013E0B0F1|nr:hypothetical protein [Tropicibacter sp. Alg240-R139]
MAALFRGYFEQFLRECDLAVNTRLFIMDVAAFDPSDRFNAAQGRFGRSQGSPGCFHPVCSMP